MLSQIEDAMITCITKAQLPYLRFVGSYGGEFDGEVPHVVRSLPGIWLAFKGESAPVAVDVTHERYKVEARLLLLVAAQGIRNEADSRHSTKIHVGTYQMLADMRSIFAFRDLGINSVECLVPGETTSLFNGKTKQQGLSVFAQEWIVPYGFYVREPGKRQLDEPYSGYLMPEGTMIGNTQVPYLPPLQRLKLCYYIGGEEEACDQALLEKGRTL
ncbi:hypothetical protein DR192_06525 [Lawsonia intracellularis]|uniref:DUF1834 family protein n=1 Tax=Lawsonia intracellularis TaxID=29546 RepID=UPI000DE2DCF8|nr:DUF1834 family protein [Lawsonia intracellularis]RBN32672.1 hypothetical protein DR192_06525 [Lawsonia intracellularis]RBN33464.1 hypothetical protein DR193_06520 [Lawsonia intracellularis]